MKVWVSADYEGRRKAMGEAWDNDLQMGVSENGVPLNPMVLYGSIVLRMEN